jgi:DMSO reductase iron-sulfur subunit
MTLPLLDREVIYTPKLPRPAARCGSSPSGLIPTRALRAGEQYRFHFDMTKCIGCQCCVVACNEQNGNPAAINWRRVGEIEGGYYPDTQRFHLSMGCNHCLEPSCLIGCPVEAYTKDPVTGVVVHSADACIGCQYCTWNCSYGVPQYNPERGVVGKCDLCHHRLSDGMAPACVAACPEEAIEIEIVNIAEWREDYLSANAPGLPSAGDSISTTRVTLPPGILPDTDRVDREHLELQDPHWPLVFMLVLTQLSVGAFAALWVLDLLHAGGRMAWPTFASLAIAAASLGASTMHLGRPIYAWRAMRGLRRSWVSREVLALSLFAFAAAAYAQLSFLQSPLRLWAGGFTVVFGLLGIFCSARIYLIRARPAWNSQLTVAAFYATALLLGPLFVAGITGAAPSWLVWAAIAGGALQLFVSATRLLWLSRSEEFELRASALLLSRQLRTPFLTYLLLLLVGGIVVPLAGFSKHSVATALTCAFIAELIGRWLFFVSVVPKNTAASFVAAQRRAA